MVVGLFGYTPLLRRQIVVLEYRGHASQEYRMLESRGRRLGILIAVLVLVIISLMVTERAVG